MAKNKNLEHIINITGCAILSGLFIYRTIEPLKYMSHPVLGTLEVGKPTYQIVAGSMAALCLIYLGRSIYDAYKDKNSQKPNSTI